MIRSSISMQSIYRGHKKFSSLITWI